MQFVVLGLCFPQFATQPFRSERGLDRAEGRTGCAGSREESESTRRVAWSSLAELWEKADTALMNLLRASSGANQTPASQSLRRPLGEPPKRTCTPKLGCEVASASGVA